MGAMLSRPDSDVLPSKKRKEAAKACEMCKSEALTRPPLLALRAPKVILSTVALRSGVAAKQVFRAPLRVAAKQNFPRLL